MKKHVLFLPVILITAAITLAFTAQVNKLPLNTEIVNAMEVGPDTWIFQKWDGGFDDECYSTGWECATLLVGDEPQVHHGLSNAISAGDDVLAEFLYSSEGLTIPFPASIRKDLASGTLTFFPKTTENGGVYYRFK